MRPALLLAVGRGLAYGLSFVRNVMLARALSKEDYGVAALFSMALTLLEVSGRMAFGVQILQSPDGECPRFQATAHSIQALGGLLSGLLLLVACRPVASMFSVAESWKAFALLALIPMLQGVCHLDVSRFQRELRFLPAVITELVPQLKPV